MLYGHADQSFYLRQLVRVVGAGHGALQRELKHLTEMGLIVRTVQGNQVPISRKFTKPDFLGSQEPDIQDRRHPRRYPFRVGIFGGEIQVAFVYGSVAHQKERADSDVDLMVLGDAPFSDVVAALSPAQRALGREINPTVYPVSEFRSKLVAGNHFLHSVMKEKRLFLLGTENELAKLASK